MNKYIVTTTINEPTEATLKFASMDEWQLVVVGDLKTPHESYEKINCIYLHPDYQESTYRELSRSIGWNRIQRRNIGLVDAYHRGADVVATVDDDNIPYDSWGKDLHIGKTIELDLYEPKHDVFDPLSITQFNSVWHRGYPIEYVPTRHNVDYKGKARRKVLIQANLWDGDPDIDAMARLSIKPCVKYSDVTQPYCSNTISPFNSQNTFLAREVLPHYSVFPHIGRMDDIWGSYIVQKYFPRSVIYDKATVYQDRNAQDLITNLEKEIVGYRNTLSLIKDLDNWETYLPEQARVFFKHYQKAFEGV
jgi:hypothetical protein